MPSVPQVPEVYDLNDFLTHCAMPTSNLIAIEVDEKGHAHFALPRMEVGQGITTAVAMLIAEELDLPVDHVHVTLAPARPELLFNQLTGGSNTIISMYTPVRVAAAIARKALLEAAAILLGGAVTQLISKDGVISLPDGSSADVRRGRRQGGAADDREGRGRAEGDLGAHQVVGKPHRRVDARAAVTGKKKFAMDLDVPNALPTMVCRAPELNGTPESINNKGEVETMPGVTHVAIIPTGVAVRAKTFGQCIDAVRALDVTWNSGTVTTMSAKHIKARAQGRADPAGGAEDRGDLGRRRVHLPLPQRLGPRAQLRGRRRTRRQGHRLGRPEVADRRPGQDRQGARPPADQRGRSTWSRAAAPSGASCSATPPSRPPTRPRRSARRSS